MFKVFKPWLARFAGNEENGNNAASRAVIGTHGLGFSELVGQEWFKRLDQSKQALALWLVKNNHVQPEKLESSTIDHTKAICIYPDAESEGIGKYLTNHMKVSNIRISEIELGELLKLQLASGCVDIIEWQGQNWLIANPKESVFAFSVENLDY